MYEVRLQDQHGRDRKRMSFADRTRAERLYNLITRLPDLYPDGWELQLLEKPKGERWVIIEGTTY